MNGITVLKLNQPPHKSLSNSWTILVGYSNYIFYNGEINKNNPSHRPLLVQHWLIYHESHFLSALLQLIDYHCYILYLDWQACWCCIQVSHFQSQCPEAMALRTTVRTPWVRWRHSIGLVFNASFQWPSPQWCQSSLSHGAGRKTLTNQESLRLTMSFLTIV